MNQSRFAWARPTIAKQACLIALLTFVSYAYFYPGGGWNQNSRFDLVRAIVERGTLQIDAYQANTNDKALYNGHYYSDKAPGQPLLAVPAAAATRTIQKLTGVDPVSARAVVALSYASGLFSVALPFSIACSALFLIALHLGASTKAAAFAAIAMGLGTPLWAYATLFWAHDLAGACLLLSFGAALLLGSGDGEHDAAWASSVGLLAGCATLAEYPAAPASAILAVFALLRVWSGGWPSRTRVALGIAAGALPCVLVLLAYQHAAFGSAIHPSYSYEAGPFPWMHHGYFGLKYPRLDVAFKLLFGVKRGLFLFAPVTAVAVFGLRLLWKNPATRLPSGAASAIFVYYLILNASYADWTTGWTYGARYMGAGIPALCVGLAPAWDYFRANGRKMLLALLAVSIFFSLAAVSTTPQPPDNLRSPLTQLILPAFFRGHMSLEHISMLGPAEEDGSGRYGSFNLGELAGLHGFASLLPLFAIWMIAAGAWVRLGDKDLRAPVPGSA